MAGYRAWENCVLTLSHFELFPANVLRIQRDRLT